LGGILNAIDKAYKTQLQNIQTKTGKTLEELGAMVKNSGLSKHGQIREMLKRDLGLGHGDANTLTHYVLKSGGEMSAQGQSNEQVLDEIYTGPKAHMRPIHERFIDAIQTFGDFEIAPKKGYVSLRRKKQFAMIGPATNSRVEVGINHKTLSAHDRLIAQPAGSMCNFKVKVTQVEEVDQELINWVKQAYEEAG
jgi:hypothetical protein